jgi:DNA polymerase V
MYYANPSGVSVHDGFPNPATDSSLQSIDLNQLLIHHSASTYFMRIQGNEWARQGIFAGDMLLVDRAIVPRGNDPAVWIKDERFALSPKHKIPEEAEVWGSVTAVIHQFREAS